MANPPLTWAKDKYPFSWLFIMSILGYAGFEPLFIIFILTVPSEFLVIVPLDPPLFVELKVTLSVRWATPSLTNRVNEPSASNPLSVYSNFPVRIAL